MRFIWNGPTDPLLLLTEAFSGMGRLAGVFPFGSFFSICLSPTLYLTRLCQRRSSSSVKPNGIMQSNAMFIVISSNNSSPVSIISPSSTKNFILLAAALLTFIKWSEVQVHLSSSSLQRERLNNNWAALVRWDFLLVHFSKYEKN